MNLSLVKPALLWLLFWQATPPPVVPASHFRYQRAIKLSPSPAVDQACAILDADVFAHASSSLKDVRLYSDHAEIPYTTTVSEPLQQDSEDARILNLRTQNGHILFDLEMPHRPYTGLSLDLAAHDYIAKATVSGSSAASIKSATLLGSFTLFDLTSQHLAHSSDIALSESTFPYLHIELTLTPAPGGSVSSSLLNLPAIVRAATVPPSREAQSLYTTTQRAVALQKRTESTAAFKVSARVPIERIAFTLPPDYKGSFSRTIKIEAQGISDDDSRIQANTESSSGAPFGVETVTGSILRVHKTEGGRQLSAESLGIPVAIGSNMQQAARIGVTVENGSDAPLPLTIELQMRQRRICFDTRSAVAPLTLSYGDPSLDAPVYTDAVLDRATSNPSIAELGPEMQLSGVSTAPISRKSGQQQPMLRWIALLACVCIFALLVLRRSAKHRPR